MENLNGSELFESMYADDSEGQKLGFMPSVEELILEYPFCILFPYWWGEGGTMGTNVMQDIYGGNDFY